MIEITETITKYKAVDGTTFNTEEECLDYENSGLLPFLQVLNALNVKPAVFLNNNLEVYPLLFDKLDLFETMYVLNLNSLEIATVNTAMLNVSSYTLIPEGMVDVDIILIAEADPSGFTSIKFVDSVENYYATRLKVFEATIEDYRKENE